MKAIFQRLKKIEVQLKATIGSGAVDHALTPEEFLAECKRRNMPPEAYLEPNYLELGCSQEEFEASMLKEEGEQALLEYQKIIRECERRRSLIAPEWKAKVYELYNKGTGNV